MRNKTVADKKKKYQKNVKTRKADKSGDKIFGMSPEKFAAGAAMTVPLAVYGAIDQFDKFKQRRKEEKLKKLSKFQNRTKIKGITSSKIIKLP